MIYVLITLLFAPLLRALGTAPVRQPRRVLVVQLAKIGDMLCSTPVFREIRRGLPGVELVVLASPATADLVRLNPHVSRVEVANAADFKGLRGRVALYRRLRAGRYEALICLNANAAVAVSAAWARIPVRLGVLPNFDSSVSKLAGKLWTASVRHRGDRLIQNTYAELLGCIGVQTHDIRKEVRIDEHARAKVADFLETATATYVGIGVSSANKLKELGSAKIAEVIRTLLGARPALRVVLIGASGDRPQAQAIIAELDPAERRKVIDSTGKFSLTELPALLMHLSAYVGVDSGITYMADALDLPLVSVAGPCNMQETRPLNEHAVIIQRELPCAPCAHIFKAPYHCYTGTLACTREVSAAEISAACLATLDSAAQDTDGSKHKHDNKHDA